MKIINNPDNNYIKAIQWCETWKCWFILIGNEIHFYNNKLNKWSYFPVHFYSIIISFVIYDCYLFIFMEQKIVEQKIIQYNL